MTQDAIVTRILDKDRAEIVVTRGTACGANCGNCESCMFDSQVKADARNLINARPGQKVIISSKSSRVYSAAILVYVVPMVLLVLGYVLAYNLGTSEGICILASFIGLVMGAVIIVLNHKSWKEKNPITFDIIKFADGSEEA